MALTAKQLKDSPGQSISLKMIGFCLTLIIAILSFQKTNPSLISVLPFFIIPVPFCLVCYLISSFETENEKYNILLSVANSFLKILIILLIVGSFKAIYFISSAAFWLSILFFALFIIISALVITIAGNKKTTP